MGKISRDVAIFIKNLYLLKGYGARKLLSEFPDRGWNRGGLNSLLKTFRQTGTIERQKGSGRPRTVRTVENVEKVEELVLSQENKPKTNTSNLA